MSPVLLNITKNIAVHILYIIIVGLLIFISSKSTLEIIIILQIFNIFQLLFSLYWNMYTDKIEHIAVIVVITPRLIVVLNVITVSITISVSNK